MPVVVSCPSCSGPLRVGDELIGRKVRCPACSTVFEAPAGDSVSPKEEWQQLNLDVPDQQPAPPSSPPVETVPVDPWKMMNLSLDEPGPKPPPAPPSQPVGALEIDRQEVAVPTAPRRDEPAGRRPRLNDDHDDMRTCPGCHKLIYLDARRCNWCGERFDEDGPSRRRAGRYDDSRRGPRRDSDNHRGGPILLLGILSLVTPFLACPTLGISTFIGVVLGVIAWVMGANDLSKMKTGAMDPEGEGNTRGGYVCGIIGVVLNLLVLLACGTFIGFAIMDAPRNRPRPVMPAPAPPPAKQ